MGEFIKKKILKDEHCVKLLRMDAKKDINADGDPYLTLFLCRLPGHLTELRVLQEFEEFGSVNRLRIARNKISGKQKTYGFIEYVRMDEMKRAFKVATFRSIEGKRLFV